MMFKPCGPSACPTEAGFAVPASSASFTVAASFLRLLGGMIPSCGYHRHYAGQIGPSDLGDLAEGELDGCLPTEDRYEHFELLRVDVDLADRRRQRGERAVHDGDGLTHFVVDFDGRLGATAATGMLTGANRHLRLRHPRREELQHLIQGQRRRPRGGTDETGDSRGVPHG